MAIASAGIGSGLDINSLISQLMALERRPLDALSQKKSTYQSQLSAFGTLQSDLSALQSAISSIKNTSSFSVYTAASTDSTIVSASATGSASQGSHSITVNNLATIQQQVSTGYADTDTTTVGTGTLTFTTGSNTFTVTIDSTNNTLSGIQNAINTATDNYGVSASILNDGSSSPNRLVIAPNDSGTSNAVTIGGTLAPTLNFSETVAAQNASLTVDGITGITKSSNAVTDVINGVTLNLNSAGAVTVSVNQDISTISSNVQNFVTAYNKLIGDINKYHQKGGSLESDNSLITVQSQIVGVLNTAASLTGNTYSYLSQVGVSIQKDGTMALDSTAFSDALTQHPNDVVALFTDTNEGFAQRLYTQLGYMLQSDGVVSSAEDSINSSLDAIDSQSALLQVRLDSTQARLQKQFTALDSLVGSLKQTSSYLLSSLHA